MSIMATVMGVVVYLLRFIKGFPKTAGYFLWSVVLIRLLIPIGLSSRYSLLNLISEITKKQIARTIPLGTWNGTQQSLEISLSNVIQGASSYTPVTYKSNGLREFFVTASVIWFIIAVFAIIAVLILYFLTKAELNKAVHLRENIYQGSMANTPVVYGILRPRIILPNGVPGEHLEYILAHERVHIRRRDNLWRMIAIVAACIHWFNPFSWIFLQIFLKDCESACDETAIRRMNRDERIKYAKALLDCASGGTILFSTAFGGSKVKNRIRNVLTYKRLTLFSAISLTGMIGIVVFLLLTNAAN